MKNLLIVSCAVAVVLAGCVTGSSRQETTPNQRASEVLQRLDPAVGDKPVRLRAVLMGSDAGTTRWGDGLTPLGAIDTLPEGYFAYLEGIHVNWVGIQVAIQSRTARTPTWFDCTAATPAR